MNTERLPLVKISSIAPLLAEIARQGASVDELLAEFGWTQDSVKTTGMFVPAQSVYDLAEVAAGKTGDPYFGANAAAALDLKKWSLLTDALKYSTSVAECLHQIIYNVRMESTSIIYSLVSDGEQARLDTRRTFQPARSPGQIDAFGVIYILKLLETIVGQCFDPLATTVVVSDPTKLPENFLPTGCLIAGNNNAPSIRFPASWLLIGLGHNYRQKTTEMPSKDLVENSKLTPEAVGRLIHENIGDPNLTAEKIAGICGLKSHELRIALRAQGAKFAKIYDDARYRISREALLNTDKSIATIAASLGYTDAANFSRAFRRWSGKTPLKYRRTRR